MIAEVEQPDGSYKMIEMGAPKCRAAFCDHCGDCLGCMQHDEFCWDGNLPRWVIYLDDPLNPASGAVPEGSE
jgi:hypothetical protein